MSDSSAAYQREWRKKNPDKVAAWRKKNSEKSAAWQREWRKKNPNKAKQRDEKHQAKRKYDENYKAKARERASIWYKEKLAQDPEGLRAKRRAVYERNKAKHLARGKARRDEEFARDPEGVRAKRRAKYNADVERSRAYAREWARRNPKRTRARNLKKFGISVEHYEALLVSQDSCCAICRGQNANGKALAVDHCHKTGRVRGLLCTNCNTGIGMLGDSSLRLKLAAEYVTRWGG